MFFISSFMAHCFLDDFPSKHPQRHFIPRLTSKMFSKSVSSATENVSKKNVVDCSQFPPPATKMTAFSPKVLSLI